MSFVWPWGKTKRVRDALAAYPALELPHAGRGAALTGKQRADNLAWFLEARSGRTAVLRETMARLGYTLPEQMPSPEAVEAASLLFHQLCRDHLAGWKLAAEGLDSRRAFDPAAAGLKGFGHDIGIFLGDAAITLRPALAWRLDNDKPMQTHGEIVIGLAPDASADLSPVAIDALRIGVYQLWDAAHNGNILKWLNSFSFVVDVANGRYERPKPPGYTNLR